MNTIDRRCLPRTITQGLPDDTESEVLLTWRFKGLQRSSYRSIHKVVNGESRFAGSVAILFGHNRPSDLVATELSLFQLGLRSFLESRGNPKRRRTLSLNLRSQPKDHNSEQSKGEQQAGLSSPNSVRSDSDWHIIGFTSPKTLPGVDDWLILDSKDKEVVSQGARSSKTGQLGVSPTEAPSNEGPVERQELPELGSSQGLIGSDKNKLLPTPDTIRVDIFDTQHSDALPHSDVAEIPAEIEIEALKYRQPSSLGLEASWTTGITRRTTMDASTTTEATSTSQPSTGEGNPIANTIKTHLPSYHIPIPIPEHPHEAAGDDMFPLPAIDSISNHSSTHSEMPFPDDYWTYDKQRRNYFHIDVEEDGTKTTIWYPEEFLEDNFSRPL